MRERTGNDGRDGIGVRVRVAAFFIHSLFMYAGAHPPSYRANGKRVDRPSPSGAI
jgi:hypothetical protein